MSMVFFGLRPSAEHRREIDARLRGEKLTLGAGAAAVAKRQADAQFEQAKRAAARAPSAEGAQERVAQARAAVAGARNKRELELAFADARRTLRR